MASGKNREGRATRKRKGGGTLYMNKSFSHHRRRCNRGKQVPDLMARSEGTFNLIGKFILRKKKKKKKKKKNLAGKGSFHFFRKAFIPNW